MNEEMYSLHVSWRKYLLRCHSTAGSKIICYFINGNCNTYTSREYFNNDVSAQYTAAVVVL